MRNQGVRAKRGRWITVEGARTHNLREVSVRVPKHRLTVFTGVSGSGKSSLAFDTIAAEAERLVTVDLSGLRPEPAPSASARRRRPDGRADLHHDRGSAAVHRNGGRRWVRRATSRPCCACCSPASESPCAGFSPAYSFNDPSGMCPRCEGLGVVDDIDLDRLLDPAAKPARRRRALPEFAPGTYRWKRLVHSGLVDPDVPLRRLPAAKTQTLLHAEGLPLDAPGPEYPKHGVFDGIVPRLRDSYLRKTASRLTAEQNRKGLVAS